MYRVPAPTKVKSFRRVVGPYHGLVAPYGSENDFTDTLVREHLDEMHKDPTYAEKLIWWESIPTGYVGIAPDSSRRNPL